MTAIVIEQEGKQIRIAFAKDNKGNETIMSVSILQGEWWVHIFGHNIAETV